MTALVVLAVILGIVLALPRLLDDRYYIGPRSDHFNGERFFNLGGKKRTGGANAASFVRWQFNRQRKTWPEHVEVAPARPPARVEGEAMLATVVGHATVLVQTAGLNILTDPVWSDRASPFGWTGPKRVRAPGVRFDDLPKIDLVLVSHNHYDHMDIATLKRLWERDRPLIVTPLGNAALLARAGITAYARDWGESIGVREDVRVTVERVQHWSTRWRYDANRALWGGFTVELSGGNLYFAGDCGYGGGDMFRDAGARGPVRLALLPVGAYEPRWFMKPQHMNPADAVAAFRDLGAQNAIGIHWGVFQLTDEAIDAPRIDLAEAIRDSQLAPDRFRPLAAGESWLVPPTLAAAE